MLAANDRVKRHLCDFHRCTVNSRLHCFCRRLQATAAQLQASAMLWAEAASHGCWQEVQQLPAAQRHLAACAQLYHESAIVR